MWKVPTDFAESVEDSDRDGKRGMESGLFADPPSQNFLVLICGAALAVSGMVYQAYFPPIRWFLPDVLGVTSGPLGAALGILLGGSAWIIEMSAFGFGLFTAFLTVALAKAVGGQQKSVPDYFRNCYWHQWQKPGLMLIKYGADPTQQLPSIDYWLMGSFHAADWKDVKMALPAIVLSIVVLWFMRWKLRGTGTGRRGSKKSGSSSRTGAPDGCNSGYPFSGFRCVGSRNCSMGRAHCTSFNPADLGRRSKRKLYPLRDGRSCFSSGGRSGCPLFDRS